MKEDDAETEEINSGMDDGACVRVLKEEDLGLDTCDGSLLSAKASFRLSEHRQFLGYETNYACFQDERLPMVEGYVMQVLSADYDLAGNNEMVQASKVFLEEIAALG